MSLNEKQMFELTLQINKKVEGLSLTDGIQALCSSLICGIMNSTDDPQHRVRFSEFAIEFITQVMGDGTDKHLSKYEMDDPSPPEWN